jgi:hypothetical protein
VLMGNLKKLRAISIKTRRKMIRAIIFIFFIFKIFYKYK